uniref:WAP domain-containing protein n=1 Tax=Hippocampus comes TaxID=109280 RepID=A0A3Q2YDU4_HIPCM
MGSHSQYFACSLPGQIKPGVCPNKVGVMAHCGNHCFDDRDCPDEKKCCHNGCGFDCLVPFKG